MHSTTPFVRAYCRVARHFCQPHAAGSSPTWPSAGGIPRRNHSRRRRERGRPRPPTPPLTRKGQSPAAMLAPPRECTVPAARTADSPPPYALSSSTPPRMTRRPLPPRSGPTAARWRAAESSRPIGPDTSSRGTGPPLCSGVFGSTRRCPSHYSWRRDTAPSP